MIGIICILLQRPKKLTLVHTASFGNIIIEWSSHDDLTKKFVFLVSSAKPMIEKKVVKWQKFKTALCDLTEKKCFCWILSACSSGLRFQINLEANSMHGCSKKNSIVSEFTLFFAEQVLFTENGLNWSQYCQVLICLLRKKFKSLIH